MKIVEFSILVEISEGLKKIMVWKHVPKVVKRQISFQYHMSQKKKGMFVLKNPSEVKLRNGLTSASLIGKFCTYSK